MSPAELNAAHDALEASIRGMAALMWDAIRGRIQEAEQRGDARRVQALHNATNRAIEAATRPLARQLAFLPPRPLVVEPGSPLYEAAKRASSEAGARVQSGHPSTWGEPPQQEFML